MINPLLHVFRLNLADVSAEGIQADLKRSVLPSDKELVGYDVPDLTESEHMQRVASGDCDVVGNVRKVRWVLTLSQHVDCVVDC